MFLPLLINWDTLIEAIHEDATDLYVDASRTFPVAEHIIAEQLLYEFPERLNEHYLSIERRQSGDIPVYEPFTEHSRLYEAVESWFALHRLASDKRFGKGGGFSCIR